MVAGTQDAGEITDGFLVEAANIDPKPLLELYEFLKSRVKPHVDVTLPWRADDPKPKITTGPYIEGEEPTIISTLPDKAPPTSNAERIKAILDDIPKPEAKTEAVEKTIPDEKKDESIDDFTKNIDKAILRNKEAEGKETSLIKELQEARSAAQRAGHNDMAEVLGQQIDKAESHLQMTDMANKANEVMKDYIGKMKAGGASLDEIKEGIAAINKEAFAELESKGVVTLQGTKVLINFDDPANTDAIMTAIGNATKKMENAVVPETKANSKHTPIVIGFGEDEPEKTAAKAAESTVADRVVEATAATAGMMGGAALIGKSVLADRPVHPFGAPKTEATVEKEGAGEKSKGWAETMAVAAQGAIGVVKAVKAVAAPMFPVLNQINLEPVAQAVNMAAQKAAEQSTGRYT